MGDAAHSSGRSKGHTLEVVQDEPSSRLGCLELYVRLVGPQARSWTGAHEPNGSQRQLREKGSPLQGGFTVEEDQRQRVLVHWRGHPEIGADSHNSQASGSSGHGLASASFSAEEASNRKASMVGRGASDDVEETRLRGLKVLSDQTWRVSCAFSQRDPEVALFETLGLEAIDWLWDGLSVLVLALGPSSEADAAAVPIFGPGVYGLPCAEDVDSNTQATAGGVPGTTAGRSQENPLGLLAFCLEELCRRACAERDSQRFCLGLSVWELCGSDAGDLLAAEGEDAATELRFETVRFQTVREALALIEASGVFSGAEEEAHGSPLRDRRGKSASVLGRNHLFVRAVVFDSRKESLAALHFAWVAGEGDHDSVGQQIAADREALWSLLESASTGEVPEPRGISRLSEVLAPLIAGNCKPFFLCSVPEKPSSTHLAAESLSLLDLAECASLITAQCTRVQGVCRQHFQLAELDDVMHRLRQHGGVKRNRIIHSDRSSPTAPGFGARGSRRAMEEPLHRANHQLAGCASSPERMPSGLAAEDEVVYDEVLTASMQLPAQAGHNAHVEDEVLTASAELRQKSRSDIDVRHRDFPAGDAPIKASARIPPQADAQQQSQSPVNAVASVPARAAHVACLEQCRELGKACVLLKAEHENKASRRKQELRKVMKDVAALREEIAAYEDKCEAPSLLDTFRSEARSLQAEAAKLRDQNAALAGAKGQDQRCSAQSATLKFLQAEASKLHQSTQDFEQGDKKAKLVRKCLSEVQYRHDIAKNRQLEVEREITDLEPAYGELGRKIEESEKRRRWVQDELDKLRRASCGLRAEICQLREVRATIDSLPPSKSQPQDRIANNSADGMERFAVLQRRLAAVAPQLMPLCTRARSEMEELVRCCHNLEERQRRLQQVGSCSEEAETASGGLSHSSSTTSGLHSGTPRRLQARSSDATTRTGSHYGSTGQLPPHPKSVVHEQLPPRYSQDARTASSGKSTPRRGMPPLRADSQHEILATPRSARSLRSAASQRSSSCNATPRKNAAAATAQRATSSNVACTTPRAPPNSCTSPATVEKSRPCEDVGTSWAPPRDGGGVRERSQDRGKENRYSGRPPSQDGYEASIEGTASALQNLGLHVQPGTGSCVHGVRLNRVAPRAKSRDGYARGAPLRSARSRSR